MLFTSLPPLCSFTEFTMSDCLVLDDMHYDRNLIILGTYFVCCSVMVALKHGDGMKQGSGLIMIWIHSLSTMCFIVSLLLVKSETMWQYHTIFGYFAYILLLLYQSTHSIVFHRHPKHICCCKGMGTVISIYFFISNAVSVTASMIFAGSRDRAYICEWVSFFALIWYFAPYGFTIVAVPIVHNPNMETRERMAVELESLINDKTNDNR